MREAIEVPGGIMGSGEQQGRVPGAGGKRRREGAGHSVDLAQILACIWLSLVVGLAIWVSLSIVAHLRAVSQAEPQSAALRAASLRFAVGTVGLAVASLAACGMLKPERRRPAILVVALIPVPIALIASHNLLAGATLVGLLAPALWLGRALGARLLRLDGVLESWVIGSALGFGFLALLGTTLALLGLLRPAVVWLLLLLVTVGLCLAARRRARTDLVIIRRWLRRPLAFRADFVALAGATIGFFWLNMIGALAPELYADAVVYRLPVSALIARTGRFTVDSDLHISVSPRFAEVVYALALAIGPLQVTKLVDLSVGLICAAGVGLVAKRLAGMRAAALAAILFYTLPLTAQLSQTAYTDLFATHFAVTAAALLVHRRQLEWRSGLAALIALVAGMSVKPSFAITAASLMIALLLMLPWRRKALIGAFVAALLGAAMLAAMVLSPIGRGVLRQPMTAVLANLTGLDAFGTERSIVAFLASPVNLILHTAQYGAGEYEDGFVGYSLLALVPLIAFARPTRRTVALLVGAATAYALWFVLAQYLRYALPGFALQCALGGAAYAAVTRRGHVGRRRVIAIALTGLIGLNVLAWLNTSLLQQGAIPYQVALGQQSRAAYLSEYLAGFAILDLFNRQPDATRVLSTHNYARLYTPHGMATVESRAGFAVWTEQEILAALDQEHFSHIIVDRTVMPANWDQYVPIDEAFLRRNAILVGGGRNAYLYRLVPPDLRVRDQEWARGLELLWDGGMEVANRGQPRGWDPVGRPTYDRSGLRSRTGQAAIRTTPQDWYVATVPIRTQAQYLLTIATRAEEEYGYARLQINWLDAAGELVDVSLEIVPSSPQQYTQRSLLATAPPGATRARVYLASQQGTLWFDDVSLRAVMPEWVERTEVASSPMLRTPRGEGQRFPLPYERWRRTFSSEFDSHQATE